MKLTDIINEDLILVPLEEQTQEAVVREMIRFLSSREYIHDPNHIFDIIMERERILSTGIGSGIAIPHGKTEGLEDPIVALGISKKGIDYKALDKKEVYLVFLLLTSDHDKGMHIRLLSRISRLLNKTECRMALMDANSPEEAVRIIREAEQKWFEIN